MRAVEKTSDFEILCDTVIVMYAELLLISGVKRLANRLSKETDRRIVWEIQRNPLSTVQWIELVSGTLSQGRNNRSLNRQANIWQLCFQGNENLGQENVFLSSQGEASATTEDMRLQPLHGIYTEYSKADYVHLKQVR